MSRWIKRIALLLAGLAGISLLIVWALLSSSLLAKTRGDLTARFLAGKLNQIVQITDGVQVDIGPVLHVTAQGVALPSQSMTDVVLAEIGQVEFDVTLSDLLKRRVKLSDLRVDNAKVALLVDQDGLSSWARQEGKSQNGVQGGKNATGLDLLTDQKIRFSNSGMIYKDARNGLELDLVLSSVELSRTGNTAPVLLTGEGTLNGQELFLSGSFPQSEPFKVSAVFDQIRLEIDGTPEPGGYGAGFSTDISAQVAELGQLLDVLKLQKSVSGKGQARAKIKVLPEATRVDDLSLTVALDGGQSLELKGDLGDLSDPTGVTIDTNIRLFSEANQPAPTKSRRDLKLVGIDMQLIAQPNGISQRRMVIETNGFVLDTSGVGPPPISFSEVSRTPDGLLRIGEVVLRIGPPDANFLVLEGVVGDALRLDGIDVTGVLSLPLASLVAPDLFQTSDVLGEIAGGFRLSGNADQLGLADLNADSQGSDLWDLKVRGSVRNVLEFSDVDLNVAVDVPSGAKLLDALDLKPIDIGAVKLTTSMSSEGTDWKVNSTIAVAESQLNIGVDIDFDEPTPTVRGQVESDLIRVDHLRDIGEISLQLTKLNADAKAAAGQGKPDNLPPATEDGKDADPSGLNASEQADQGKDDSRQSGPFRDVSLQPLGRAILLSGMDLSVRFDLRNIEGDKGSTSLKTDIEVKDEKARFGPVKFDYDGANFDVGGSIDLKESPDILKLKGSTGGWSLGKILRAINFKKKIRGVLYAGFDISGNHTSIRDFLSTMNGSATISMRNGSIDSQLLDLAGLGVIPWLFTKKKGPTATIVCVRAPLSFSGGRIATERTVVETDRVQIVVLGDVNLKKDTLDIVGQPRRIGKPLSRSPWPFTAVGPISKPKIKVKDGPRRLRRSDGATRMPQRRKICVPDILQLK